MNRDALAAWLNDLMEEEAVRFLAEVPFASHLTDSEPLDIAYYVRHRIETIKRIRFTARTYALALAAMVDEDYEAARPWAAYVAEELGHDTMFLEDLASHGVTAATVDATPPFAATRELIGYLDDNIRRYG